MPKKSYTLAHFREMVIFGGTPLGREGGGGGGGVTRGEGGGEATLKT